MLVLVHVNEDIHAAFNYFSCMETPEKKYQILDFCSVSSETGYL